MALAELYKKETSQNFNFLLNRKYEILFLIVVFSIAFALRLSYMYQIQGLPSFKVLIVDALSYNNWAKEIIRDGWLGKEIFYQAPLYPYFLAVIYKVFGIDLFAVRFVQVVISSLVCVIFYYVGKLWMGNKAGVVMSFFSTFYGIYIFYSPIHLKPTLYLFLEALFLLSISWSIFSNKRMSYFISGIILGIMVLCRENTILVILFVFVWLVLFCRKDNKKKMLINGGLLALGVFLALTPSTVRNYVVGGDFVIATSQGGTNFYIGNGPKATGSYVPLLEHRQTPPYEGIDAKQLAEEELGMDLSASEVSAFWYSKSLNYIVHNKLDYLKLMWTKVQLFFNAYEIPDAEDYYFYREFSSILNLPLVSFGFICPLALVGICISFREFNKFSILYFLAAANILSVVMFYIFSRYRLPIVPFFMLFATYALLNIFRYLRLKHWRQAAIFFALLIAAYLFSHFPKVSPQNDYELSHFNLGLAYEKAGNIHKAIEEYESAIALSPSYLSPYNNLAVLRYNEGKYKEAIELWNKMVEIKADGLMPHFNLGKTYLKLGEYEQAKKEFYYAIEIDPTFEKAINNQASIYFNEENYLKAVELLKKSNRLNPNNGAVLLVLAKAQIKLGDFPGAKLSLMKLLQIERNHPEAAKLLEIVNRGS